MVEKKTEKGFLESVGACSTSSGKVSETIGEYCKDQTTSGQLKDAGEYLVKLGYATKTVG